MTFSRFFSSSSDDDREDDAEMQGPRDGDAVLPVGINGLLTLSGESLVVQGLARKTRFIPYFNILWAEISDTHLNIKYANPISKHEVGLACIRYTIERSQVSKAEKWVSTLLDLSYGEAQQKKRIMVLINPFGGKGNASRIFSKEVQPIFEAAGCKIGTRVTEYSGHAVEIAKEIDEDAWDVITACSGDGTIYEIFNGLGKKENAAEALAKLAIAHVPCGSGNAMSRNLNGIAGPSMAALCIIKGLRTPLDLISVTHGEERTLSFLSQAFGIIADSDLGTDNIRWMGPARFTFGFLVRLLGNTVYPCDIALKVEIDDKNLIRQHFHTLTRDKSDIEPRKEIPKLGGLPLLKYSLTDPIPDDWTRISHDKLGNFYSGKMPFMAQDANFFPASLPNDGFLDVIMIRGDISRITALKMLGALDHGELFDMPDVHALKISAFRITPRTQTNGYISIDGEQIPYGPFQAEVHKGLGTVISLSGLRYETGDVF